MVVTALVVAAYLVAVAVALRAGHADPRRHDAYGGARVTSVLGSAYLLTAIAYLVDPEVQRRTALGAALNPFGWVPYAFYALGGTLALIGYITVRRELEAAALVALGTGWLTYGLALYIVHPADLRCGVYALWLLYAVRRWGELEMTRR
jgi:hypothetical protein